LKGRGTPLMEGYYILFFIRNGANFAHFFRQWANEAEMHKKFKISDNVPVIELVLVVHLTKNS